jgi:hypothetical protein
MNTVKLKVFKTHTVTIRLNVIMTKLKILVAPQKFSRSPEALVKVIRKKIFWHRPHIIFLTEIGIGNPKRAEALKKIPGYSLVHVEGLGKSECGFLIKKSGRYLLSDWGTEQLKFTSYNVPGNKQRANVHLIKAKLRLTKSSKRVTIRGGHWPNTEGNTEFKPPMDRVISWQTTCRNTIANWTNDFYFNSTEFGIDVADYNCLFNKPNGMRNYLDTKFKEIKMHRKTGNKVSGVASAYFSKDIEVDKVKMIQRGVKKASDHPFVLYKVSIND